MLVSILVLMWLALLVKSYLDNENIMTTPDFSYKIDPTVISAFQNAQQLKLQQEQAERQKQNDDFNKVVETSKAVSGLVTSFVEGAEKRKIKQMREQAMALLSKPKPTERIPVQGPSLENTPQPTISNPEVDLRRKAALSLMPPSQLGETAANLEFPGQSSAANTFGAAIPVVNRQTGERSFLQISKFGDKKLANGQEYNPDWEIDRRAQVRTDPRTGELINVSEDGKATTINSPQSLNEEVNEQQDLTVKQSKRLDDFSKMVADDDVIKINRTSLNNLNNLKTIQNEGTGALIGALQSLRARGLANEKGVLTEQDVARTTGSPQLARRFTNAASKMISGKENPDNIREFKEALAAVEKMASLRNRQIEEKYVRKAKATKELHNVSEDLIREIISSPSDVFTAPEPKQSVNSDPQMDALAKILGLPKKK